ncbi:MAG: hypothetical protein HYU81_02460 [Candidatus Brennerbacteria bacterium]|nr:hypothetical protein [Candidatus Brennerbacteria bacterium]
MAHQQGQWEEEAIERFRVFLGQERATDYVITGREVVVDQNTNENFDYQLQSQDGTKVAVELSRIVESGEELAHQKVFGSFIEHLKKELLSRGIKGYFISTPEFPVKKKDIAALSLKIANDLEKVIKENGETKRFKGAGFEFSKVEDLDTIVFSYHSGVKSIDPRGTASSGFAIKLPKKNRQIAVPDHEGILVFVSWAMFVDGADAIRALSTFDFSNFQNIDKIFFEPRQGQFVLVYDRTVTEAIKNKQPISDSSSLRLMLQYARYQLGEKKPEAFEYVKAVTTLAGNLNWLEDNQAKENLISYGEELLDKEQIEDTMWIVRQLHNDSNPHPDGTNESDDPKGDYNYHEKTLRGEDVGIIATVRGHLCWLMMKIVAKNKPEYYTEIIDIMTRYLKEANLFIRIQASFILDELWRRRRATRNQDGSMFAWEDKERVYIRQLALDTIRENHSYARVMEALLHIFNSVRDLNEKEAEEMLELFLETKDDDVLHDLAALIVYFALFRENDSQYYGGDFNPNKFVSILKNQIKNGAPSMRSSLAWHIWKLLKDNALPYEKLKGYPPLFLEGKYAYKAQSELHLILEELIKIAPDDALMLYECSIKLLEDFLKTKPDEGSQYWINNTEEMLSVLAKDPDRLISIVGRLKNIWMTSRQIYIGNIKTIFESYQLVAGEQKEKVKETLKSMYNDMKAIHPPLQEVDWTK